MIRGSARYSKYFTFIQPFIRSRFIRTYTPFVLTLWIIIIFILFALKPTLETIVVLQKKQSDAQQILKNLDQKIADLNLAKQNYDNLGENIKSKIQQTIPDNITVKTIAASLEDSARRNDASISALQLQSFILEPKRENSQDNLAEIEFTFNIEGAYQNLLLTLQQLKSTSRLIKITSVSFHSTEGESRNLVMSISGKAYFMK